MSPICALAELTRRGVDVAVRNGRLCVRPSSALTTEVRSILANHKSALIELLAFPMGQRARYLKTSPEQIPSCDARPWPYLEEGRLVRWRKSDEWGCQKCKHCGGPFIWAQVVADTDPKAKRRAFFKLDPDLGFHGCGGPRAGRFTYEEGQPTHRGTNP